MTVKGQGALVQLLKTSYGLHNFTIAPIKVGVSNSNYLVASTGVRYILRVCRFAPDNQITNAISFMNLNPSVGYAIPKIIKTLGEQNYTYLDESPVLLMTFAPGASIDARAANAAQITSLAHAIASLHNLDWRSAVKSRTLWPGDYAESIYNEFVLQLPSNAATEDYLSLMRSAKADILPQAIKLARELPHGPVHNDLTPDNVLYEGEVVSAIVDWEEVGTGVPLFDLGRALDAWFFQDGEFRLDKIRVFLDAYESRRSLTALEKDNLGLAMRYEAFLHSIYIAKIWLRGTANHNIFSAPNFEILQALERGYEITS